MRIRIVASARNDLDEGYQFYESQEPGLGDYFISSTKADIEGLRVSAGIHPVKHKGFRRMLCRVFPFAVDYRTKDDQAIVYAVIDCRRDPAWIRRRLAR